MKKALILVISLLFINSVFAQNCCDCSKCTDLKTSMHNQRAALYNVLNLSDDQQKCKDTIDMNYLKEAGAKFEKYEQEKFVYNNMKKHNASKSALNKQQKVVKNIEKDLAKLRKKYDNEFKSILNSEQKAKFNTISKMEKKETSYCKNQKAFTKHDPKYRKFGENMYYGNSEKVVCPVHNKRHILGITHNIK